MLPPADDDSVSIKSRLAFGGALLLALFLRGYELQGQSLSSDEIIEASIARLPWREIVTYPDGFPPLYHLLLAAWTKISPSPEAGRWLSVLAGVAAVYAVGRWASRTVSPAAGAFAALLVAVSPPHIYLSQELRAYSLYICFASFAMMFFFEALNSDRRRSWSAFAISMALAVNTHYYASLLAGLLGLLLLFYKREWTTMRRGCAAFVPIAIFSAPALLLLPGDVAYQSDGFAAKAPLLATLGHTVYAFFAGYSLGPSLTELHVVSLRDASVMAAPWIAAFAVTGGWLLWHGWQRLRSRPYGPGIIFLALASAPLIGLAGELAGVGPKVRYWSWILMPLLIWLAAGAARGWDGPARWLTRLAFAALVTLQLVAVAQRYDNPRYANEDMRSAATYLKQRTDDKSPVFVVADYMAPPVRYYLNGESTLYHWLPHAGPKSPVQSDPHSYQGSSNSWTVHPRSEADVRGSVPFDELAIHEWRAAVRTVAGDRGRFWLLYSRPFHGDRDGALLRYVERSGLVQLDREFPGVKLYRGQLSR